MLYLYSLGTYIYGVILQFASFFDPKAKLLIIGREQSISVVKSIKLKYPDSKWIWIHAASLGEFEQGRYLIDRISADYSQYKIALSFYSPSGYVPQQNCQNVDMVFYMPLDTVYNANKLIDTLSPHLAIFIKYDFWWNHLNALQSKSIPTVFISTMIRSDQYFIKYKLGSIRSILSSVDHYYVQTQKSADLLQSIGIVNTTVTGDSRLDSILFEEVNDVPIQKEILDWKSNGKCIIYGSVHLSDMEIIKEMSSINAKHLIVPHDIDSANITAFQSQLPASMIYSQSGLEDSSMVILDKLGVLRHIYNTADLVYIGGGFGKGIHNILEPLVQLIPILIGSNYHKFPEAVDLITEDAIKTIDTATLACIEAKKMLIESNNEREKTQKHYIKIHSGATEKILSSLGENKWI
ncbi:MAG: glycosyltransferase N-terminal domain-containing protein [Saprospiraceae bacterium]|nr:glycosyltransferase N-terminal domain-containing protein [Saprospiraceae bacterium]